MLLSFVYCICLYLQMSSSKKVIELFYDVVSPYSWLGFEVSIKLV